MPSVSSSIHEIPKSSKQSVHEPKGKSGHRARLKQLNEISHDRKFEEEALKQYARGPNVKLDKTNKRLRPKVIASLKKRKADAILAKQAEILQPVNSGYLIPENELEKTYRVTQDDIVNSVSLETGQKKFSLRLENLGPYQARYSQNGRHLILAGRLGHVATMNWRDGSLGCELFLNETVRCSTWLHNELYFAVAQKRFTYIYDSTGMEIHNLQSLIEVTHMEFLPYHFLLASIGNAGYLKYLDTSTGKIVCEYSTRHGTPTAFTQNPSNAIIHVGHQNGDVSLCCPSVGKPLVQMFCHRGPVRSLGVDREGRYMVSTGQDLQMAIWDLRMQKLLNKYFLRGPTSSLAISDRGLTAVACRSAINVWKGLFDRFRATQEKIQSPYLNWDSDGDMVESVEWCPYEDVLGVGHSKGFSSIIVPGAGEPNFDAHEVNPYETRKQRQEAEVKRLLNKIQPELITLNPESLGKVEKELPASDVKENAMNSDELVNKLKERGRGKNSALRKYLRKRGNRNVIDETRVKVQAALEQRKQREKAKMEQQKEEYGPALERFAQKMY